MRFWKKKWPNLVPVMYNPSSMRLIIFHVKCLMECILRHVDKSERCRKWWLLITMLSGSFPLCHIWSLVGCNEWRVFFTDEQGPCQSSVHSVRLLCHVCQSVHVNSPKCIFYSRILHWTISANRYCSLTCSGHFNHMASIGCRKLHFCENKRQDIELAALVLRVKCSHCVM